MKIIRLDIIVHELGMTVSLMRLGIDLVFSMLPVSVFFRNDLNRDHFSYHRDHKRASLLPNHEKSSMHQGWCKVGTQKTASCAGFSFQTHIRKGHFFHCRILVPHAFL